MPIRGEITSYISAQPGDQLGSARVTVDRTAHAVEKQSERSKFAETVGGCPCDECPRAQECKDGQLACKTFAWWQQGRGGKPGKRDREPTREQYLRILA